MNHLLFIRHGETDANRLGIVQGHQPTPLNALGHRQARRVADRLAGYQPTIDRLVCSDLLRARQTATPIADALNLTPSYTPAWRERCYGTFEGKSPAERDRMRQVLGLEPGGNPPGARHIDDFQNDILAALHLLPTQYPDARCIAIITHGGAFRAITMALADGRLQRRNDCPAPTDFSCPNCAIMHLTVELTKAGSHYSYDCLYDTAHLQEMTTVADSG